MKILFVSRLERWVRAVRTITKYVELGQRLASPPAGGHDPALRVEHEYELGALLDQRPPAGSIAVHRTFTLPSPWHYPRVASRQSD